MTPSTRGRGRPPLPDAERRRRCAERDAIKRDRRRAQGVLASLVVTPQQSERLAALRASVPLPTAAQVVVAITRE